jgi:hypothetical protein
MILGRCTTIRPRAKLVLPKLLITNPALSLAVRLGNYLVHNYSILLMHTVMINRTTSDALLTMIDQPIFRHTSIRSSNNRFNHEYARSGEMFSRTNMYDHHHGRGIAYDALSLPPKLASSDPLTIRKITKNGTTMNGHRFHYTMSHEMEILVWVSDSESLKRLAQDTVMIKGPRPCADLVTSTECLNTSRRSKLMCFNIYIKTTKLSIRPHSLLLLPPSPSSSPSMKLRLHNPIPHTPNPQLKHQIRTQNPHDQLKVQIQKLDPFTSFQFRKQSLWHSS